MLKPVLILLALLPAAFWQRAEAAGKMEDGTAAIARWAANSQGSVSSGGGYSLYTAVGETAFAKSAGGGFAAAPGYIGLAAQPGSVVAITAMTKSTGTLELAWAAPGADGFQGAVINGVYRLDYSSDPAHAFSPQAYRAEFSTSVAAGEAQTLTIDGLQPNTTYYTRIYLGDSGKVLAGDSAQSSESTLADVPLAPFFSKVSPCAATVSWILPGSVASGYDTQASTTSFGLLSPGGSVKTASTPDGLKVSLTLGGLSPATAYYFRVASLNWQGEKNYTTLIATATPAGVCREPVSALSAAGDALGRAVTLTWINPEAPSPEGVVVMLSTSPYSADIADGTQLAAGQVLADGSVIKSTGPAGALADSGLTLDTTFFYHLMAKYSGPVYSVGVSTAVFLDLPPMAPAGLAAAMNSARTAVTLTWTSVASNLDGSIFKAPASPMREELDFYRVERSSSVAAPNWVAIATLPATAQSYTDSVGASDPSYLYRVTSVDSFGTRESAMGVDANRGIYVFSPDQVARLEIPAELSPEMLASGNSTGSDILIRAVDEGPSVQGSVFSSVRFEAVKTPGNEVVERFAFSEPRLKVAVRYETSGGRVTASAASPSGPISASDAAQRLGLYWNNGEKYVKLYGKVDTVNQLVSVQSAMTGSYQVRDLYRDLGVHFDISNLSNRAITPNGDGLNDTAILLFDNPRDSAFSGKIYDLSGAFVSDMRPGPVANSLLWDGKAGGRPVTGGAYVYQVKAEGKTYNGTLLVIR